MQSEALLRLKSWFDTYARSFLQNDATQDGPLALKIAHTARVCDNIRQLARSIAMNANDLRIAETVGLFHDIGRFEQFRRYGTFNDRQSANHASLGIEVLDRAAVLDALPNAEKAIIIDAVRLHNAPSLPANRPPAATVFMRLIRDADKLDIWKVFADYYRRAQLPEPVIIQHLPDAPTWQDTIVDAIRAQRKAAYRDMRSLNDYKLIQLSWVFELHFRETFVQTRKRGDLAIIARALPDAPVLREAIACVMKRLEEYSPGLTDAAGSAKGAGRGKSI
jgi:HD domain